MCGINGITGIYDKALTEKRLKAMNQALAHRGPDDEGVFSDDFCGLAQRRLSIIDLSQGGHQPMSTADGRLTIAFNGEIYNFKELRFELERVKQGDQHAAYNFRTNSDTEVILAAYLRWGADCLNHFNGMFAFAIWDKQKREVFIARDRLGIKPLYFHHTGKEIVFSSEIRALLASGLLKAKISNEALSDYLAYQTVHAPNSILSNVEMLMPGQKMLISNGNELLIETWWKLSNFKPHAGNEISLPEAQKEVRQLLLKSVERRLVSDVPFGAFLSGGIDSSAIVGLMTEVAPGRVKTFSVTFDDEEFSEARFARMVAEKFKTEHHEIKLRPEDFRDDLIDALNAMDHPSGDGPNTYVVSKATKNAGITMALSGLGGDELFAGYSIFKRMLKFQKLKWLGIIPGPIRALPALALKTLRPGIAADKIFELLSLPNPNLAAAYKLNRKLLSTQLQNEYFPPSADLKNTVEQIVSAYKIAPGGILTWVSQAEISTYMQNVLLRDTDQMSMAHALEVRVPFLDYKLVEYVLQLPDHIKNPITPKKLLVDSLGDLLPADIVNRPKMGFTLPWNNWMRNDLRSLCEEKLKNLAQRGILNEKTLNAQWNRFLKGDPSVSWSRIWYLVVLAYWLDKNHIDG